MRGVNPSNPALIAISRAPGTNGTEPAMRGEETAREVRTACVCGSLARRDGRCAPSDGWSFRNLPVGRFAFSILSVACAGAPGTCKVSAFNST
jgi:hypothetical protein